MNDQSMASIQSDAMSILSDAVAVTVTGGIQIAKMSRSIHVVPTIIPDALRNMKNINSVEEEKIYIDFGSNGHFWTFFLDFLNYELKRAYTF